MDIVLEQAFASIIRYVQDHASAEKLYFDELPENFAVPSIYFPVPTTESTKATFETWMTEIYVDVWFMGATDWLANAGACAVRDSLLHDECCIGIINEDGTVSGDKLRLAPPRTMKLSERCVQLTLRLRHYHSFDRQETALEHVHINGPVSQDVVNDAWRQAHASEG